MNLRGGIGRSRGGLPPLLPLAVDRLVVLPRSAIPRGIVGVERTSGEIAALDISGQHNRLGPLGDVLRLLVRIDEAMSVQRPRVEPGLNGRRRAVVSRIHLEDDVPLRIRPFGRDRLSDRDHLVAPFLPDLDKVPVGLRIDQLEHIRTRLQCRARHDDRVRELQQRPIVPLRRSRACGQPKRGGKCEYRHTSQSKLHSCSPFFILPMEYSRSEPDSTLREDICS